MASLEGDRSTFEDSDLRAELVRDEAWRLSLATYAATASHWRKRWIPYRWIRYVARRIEKALQGGGARLIINAPPRHGKSELISHWLPVWYLDWFPDRKVIAACYGDSLASDWGRMVRDELLMNSACWTKVRRDTQAVNDWRTNEGGGMRTAGVGGPLTGKGADLCIARGQRVFTKRGLVPIENVLVGDLVFTHRGRWRSVLRAMKHGKKRVVRLTGNGATLICTHDHRLLSPEGWIEAAQRSPIFAEDVRAMQRRVYAEGSVPSSYTSRALLLARVRAVFRVESLSRATQSVRAMRQAYSKRTENLLLGGMSRDTPTRDRIATPTGRSAVRVLRRALQASNRAVEALLKVVSSASARRSDAREQEPELQARSLLARALSAVSQNYFPRASSDARSLLGVLKSTVVDRASYRREQAQRRAHELGGSLSTVSYALAQVEEHGEEEVFDLEVEGDSSFVVEGFVAHNCIVDDPHKNWEDAMSPIARQRLIDWFNAVLYTRLEPNASMLIVQTRWHEEDLTGYLLNDHEDDWQLISLPALAEQDDMLGRDEGNALCPQRFDRKALIKIRAAIGAQMFSGIYQQGPAPAEGAILRRDQFNYYDTLPQDLENLVLSFDLTFDDDGSSYVVGQAWGRRGPDFYLLDQERDRLDFDGQIALIRRMRTAWPTADAILIEKKANGAAAIKTVRKVFPAVIPINPHTSKEVRLVAVQPLFAGGNVYVPSKTRAAWVEGYVEELVTFPRAKNDDQVDGTTQALLWYQGRALPESDAPDFDPASLLGGARESEWRI